MIFDRLMILDYGNIVPGLPQFKGLPELIKKPSDRIRSHADRKTERRTTFGCSKEPGEQKCRLSNAASNHVRSTTRTWSFDLLGISCYYP